MDKFWLCFGIAAIAVFSIIGGVFGYTLYQSSQYWAEVDRYAIAQLEAKGLTVLEAQMQIPHQIAGTGDINTFIQWAQNINSTTVYKIGGNNMFYVFQTQHINGEDFQVCYWYQAH